MDPITNHNWPAFQDFREEARQAREVHNDAPGRLLVAVFVDVTWRRLPSIDEYESNWKKLLLAHLSHNL